MKELSTIACLVNNVGIFYPDSIPPWPESSQVSFEFISRIAHCNMVSTASMTRIVPISSQFPMPYLSLYCSTKAFILSFTEALREELADTSIVIQAVCPSLVATDPTTFAQSALDMLGVESVTSGFIYHAVMREIMTRLPLNKIKQMVRKTMEKRENKSKICHS
ncbi:unnamed protein product [Echinostoma caproni]|uniref:SDR family NAD(P)-dependent oxidoreductase n=1 Tax=Echinostoma caproni TaxID=27848 RepID=A0A183BBJ3_9TREM|nr:unnamed protein product [Echinostoma caproni]